MKIHYILRGEAPDRLLKNRSLTGQKDSSVFPIICKNSLLTDCISLQTQFRRFTQVHKEELKYNSVIEPGLIEMVWEEALYKLPSF